MLDFLNNFGNGWVFVFSFWKQPKVVFNDFGSRAECLVIFYNFGNRAEYMIV